MSDIVKYYQTIPELGIYGRMNTPEEFERIGLPQDLKRWSVLDIGCNIGAFLLECHKRGATTLSGIEPNNDWRWLCEGIFYEKNIEAAIGTDIDDVIEPHDLVLLLSISHLVYDPQSLVDKAWKFTKKLFILEVNDRLQTKDFTIPIDAKRFVRIGKNKDNRSVYHLWK